ncbi:hypothetical protein KSC_039720 [Ktedonobacter sp. SOSP1-52]|uniref:DUF1998 domain-containing protein n=1 Tax=Ktedonobacter sp. SOSP1-52 TaxID=2778366 RepID=UPI00191542A4|nr:DUF1998 domain-containing protein [Ktedonobacter sp. SOSP1-52]GHO65080.1 hypothetical protein KSC_039720 [Ktedonobacter sp. SOSP1-52]
MNTSHKRYNVGAIRPSQALFTYGVGAVIDLPRLSTLVMGLDEWNMKNAQVITEDRLLQIVQSVLGGQVQQLLSPPATEETGPTQSYAAALTGIPVVPFPRWMRCPWCSLLASIDDGYFTLKSPPNRPDKVRYVHENCPKANRPDVIPVRYMIACDAGHLDDFPWNHFVHGGRICNKAVLRMMHWGASGEFSDTVVKCDTCNTKPRPISEAFNSDENQSYHPECRGRRPHLRDFETKRCQLQARTVLLSASNIWFPLVFNTLSLPTADNPINQLIDEHWNIWQAVSNLQEVALFRKVVQHDLRYQEYSNEAIWERIQQKTAVPEEQDTIEVKDLKRPEWNMLINPEGVKPDLDFQVSSANVPEEFCDSISQIVLVERLREVRALTGFTRLESLSDYIEDEKLPRDHIMPLSRNKPSWVPASEVRGEGIFIQFREEAIQRWLEEARVQEHNQTFFTAHKRWRQARNIADAEANYPDIRYVLLHTFSHALMRQLTLESGYTAASIRERIYAQGSDKDGSPMAGILLYTSASDSEGTLGGLVNLGKNLAFHLEGALDEIKHCASDPLCAEHARLDDATLHGAACHACMFAPETSCERGNRYLDRSVLVPTVENASLAFFHPDNA